EVMARIVDVIADDRLGRGRLEPGKGLFAEHMVSEAVKDDVEHGAPAHRREVSRTRSELLLGGGLVLALLILFRDVVVVMGADILTLLGWPWAPERIWTVVSQGIQQHAPWLVGVLHWLVGSAGA